MRYTGSFEALGQFVATSTSLNLRGLLKTAITRSGMDRPARVVSGLTPAAKALYVAAAAQGLPRGAVLLRRAERRRHRTGGRGCHVLLRRDGRALERRRRARHSAVSFTRSRSVPWAGAPRRRHLRPCPRALRRRHRQGPCGHCVRCGAAAAHQRPRPPRRRGAGVESRTGDRAAAIWPTSSSTPASPARIRPTSTDEFAIRGGIVDIFPAGEAQPVRLEFIGDTIESLRRYDPATQRSVATVDQIAIVPLQDVLSRATAGARRSPDEFGSPGSQRGRDNVAVRRPSNDEFDRSATVFDYLRIGADLASSCPSGTRVETHGISLSDQLATQLSGGARPTGESAAARYELFDRVDRRRARGSTQSVPSS